jgi:cystathionine beta-synthase
MGTGGTISGTGKYLKQKRPDIRLVGVDPVGSLYYDYVKTGQVTKAFTYKVEGIGEDFYPATMDLSLVDRIVRVTDKESFVAARRLAREEGILVGSSSGSALQATMTVAAELPESSVVVVVFPDTGRNYLSKFFSDEWMRENGFLERMAPARVREVVAATAGGALPALVTVGAGQTVEEAIDLMQRWSISQLPVVEDGAGSSVVGSIQERSLLDRIYRDPKMVNATVGMAMEPPFPQVPADAPIDEAFAALLKGDVAVLVMDGEAPAGVVTRADLLRFVAHPRHAA